MPSLGRDLQLIRTHLGYSIEDIKQATKLPIDTIHSIEDGSIFSDSKEINTYIRSFVRTYGRAIKLDNDLLSKALDQEELGNYTNLLLLDFPELREDDPEINEEDPEKEEKDETQEKESEKKKRKAPSFTFAGEDDENTKSTKATKPEKPKSDSKTSTPPDVRSIDWAGLGKGYKKRRTQPPVWIISAGLIVILIVAAAVLISQFGLLGSEEDLPVQPPVTDMQEPTQNRDLTLDLTDDIPEEPEPETVLSDTLYVTVYAASGRLEPVRVWSDLKPRIDPYWLDQGTAMNFEFSDTIRVAGGYSNMLLFLNGNRIENFRNDYYNSEENAVELTRNIFNSDPQWATPVPFELPPDISAPDTLMNRPSF